MYKKISLTRFLIAAIVISIPAIFLTETGNSRNAWIYVGIVLLSMLVFYGDQLNTFVTYIGGVK